MKTHLLVALAASSLGGSAFAQQAPTSLTQSVLTLVHVAVGVRPPAAEAPAALAEFGDQQFRREYAMALSGDRDAMMEVAKVYGRGSNGVARDERAMIGWLRQASELHHAGASYQLYLHFLERGRDRDALRYEALALRQGYVLPTRLDPRRG